MSNDDLTGLFMAGMDKQGVLTKVKAQIKASLYKVMDQNTEKKGGASYYFWENQKGAELHKNKSCVMLLELIKEFLQFFDFDYTLSVFSSECNIKEVVKRDSLCEKIGILKKDIDSQKPVLLHIFTQYTAGAKVNLKPSQQDQTVKVFEEKSQPIKPYDLKNKKNEPIKQQQQSQQELQQKKIQPKEVKQLSKVDKFNSSASTSTQLNKKNFGEFEEIEEDDMMDNESQIQKITKQKDNAMFSSSEDFLASQSQGFDITVDSMELEQYDHIEEILHKR